MDASLLRGDAKREGQSAEIMDDHMKELAREKDATYKMIESQTATVYILVLCGCSASIVYL